MIESGVDDSAIQQWLTRQQAELPLLFRELQQQLRENAAGFGAVAAPQRQLDPIPLLIQAPQWHQLEAGVRQRHRLLQLVLADIYGAQQCLKNDWLPAEVLFRSPAFLANAVGLISQTADWLPLFSVDLVRTVSGLWQVQADHALIPAGLGYLVEQRLAFNHIAPLQKSPLVKAQIAGFYRRLQQRLQQPVVRPAPTDALSGVWITSVHSPQYFEQAYLANYLDLAVVHGADLTFRDGALWLKTMSGLKPVSALMRYLPDSQVDPLELEPAPGGCAGLFQTIRQQQLDCLNPPGSSLIDTGLLQPFLPDLCQTLLGEELILKQNAALWLGDSKGLQQFLLSPADYRLRRISDQQQWLPARLSADNWALLLGQIQQDQADFIALPITTLQTEPIWQPDSGPGQMSLSLRMFSLADHQQPAQVLPGGYARLSSDPIQLQAAMGPEPALQLVKDVWVLADCGVTTSLLQDSTGSLHLSRHSGLVTSRVADHLYWLGRYNERLNQICRALRAALHLAADGPGLAAPADLQPLLLFCRQANGCADGEPTLDALLRQLFDPAESGSLFAILQALLLNAQSAREYFAADTWLLLDKLQQALRLLPDIRLQSARQLFAGPCLRQLDEIILLQTALYGLNNETMSRTQALRMMDLGQHIERGMQTAAMLQAVFVPVKGKPRPSATLMEAVLRLADTVNTYRRRYRSQLHPLAVIDLLVFDDSTPRSVGYQCQRIQRQCADLPVLAVQPGLSPEQRLALELVTLLQLTDPQTLFDAEHGATPALGLLLSQIQHRLKLLSDSITLSYFNHAPPGSRWQRF